MASTVTSRKLKMQFNVTPSESSTSTKRTWTFNYISEEVTESNVQGVATAMITNGSIFDTPPVSIITGIIEETTTEQIIPAA